MKKILIARVLLAQAATYSIAADSDKEAKEDIAKHRATAQAEAEAIEVKLKGEAAGLTEKAAAMKKGSGEL